MSRIETIRVKSVDDFTIINKADFDPEVHELLDGAANGSTGLVEIPDDWEQLHWKKQAALAKAISGDDVSDKDTAGVIILDEIERRINASE